MNLVVAGYGVEAKPNMPVGVAHLANGALIFGPLAREGVVRNVALMPKKRPTRPLERRIDDRTGVGIYSSGEVGTTFLALGVGMTDYEPVLSTFRTAEHSAGWRLVTDDHEIRWPARFTLRADGDPDPRRWPYELALDGSRDHILFLYGPLRGSRVPVAEHFVGAGMSIVLRGEIAGVVAAVPYIELAYERAGQAWRQRVYWLPLDAHTTYLMRAQATAENRDTMFGGADKVARSFRPRSLRVAAPE